MTGDLVEHKFNDDLLLDSADRTKTAEAFPAVAHVLDHPELRAYFKEIDPPAKAAKRRSRIWGTAAVLLAAVSLLAASAEPLYRNLPEHVVNGIGTVAAFCGILSIVVGFGGLLFWRSKKQWLYRRLVAERIRQFHFQTFVCRAEDVLQSLAGEDEKRRFIEKRKNWFAEFQLRFSGKLAAEFSSLLGSEKKSGVWLHEPPRHLAVKAAALLPDDFFRSYRHLRIRHQTQYTGWKLRQERSLFSVGGLQQLEATMTGVSLLAILAIFILHLIIGVTTGMGLPLFAGSWGHVLAIWCAILVLAVRTLEEGLQPKQELERYRRYQIAVEDLLERFDAAKAHSDKLAVMTEMERLTYQEMCDFLIANYEARFVM
jgi:hypothetical protein